MDENNQELNQEVISTETVNSQEVGSQTKFKAVGQINEKKPKKKKGKAGKVIFLLLILAIIAGIVGYFGIYTNPKVVYQQILKSGVTYFIATPEEMTTTSKTKVKLDVDVSLNEEYMSEADKELLDVINNIDAMLEVQMDTNEKKAICRLVSNYEEEELLNLDVLMDVKNKGTYIKVSQFFDNILEVEMEDEYYDELESALLTEEEIAEEQLAKSKAVKIISDEMAKMIKDEYCSKETEIITIGEIETKTDMYILKMTSAQLMTEIKTLVENLKNNEEYLNCFEDKEGEKERLAELLENLEGQDGLETETVCIRIYKSGFRQEVVRVDFEVEYEEEKLLLKIEKQEGIYKVEVLLDEKICCTGTIELQEIDENTIKASMKLDAEDIGSLELNIETSYITDEPIDVIETENAVKMDELSTEDILNAYDKLEKSKIYDFVEDILLLAYDI